MSDDNEFMQRAVTLSIENVKSKKGGPFGAVVVSNGVIIAEGVNKVTENCDSTAHAEIIAIRNACKALNTFDLSNCDLYTSCFPCPMCFGAISWSRFRNVYYANTRDDAHNIGFDDLVIYEAIENRKLGLQQMHCKEAIEAFKMWTIAETKVTY